MIPSYTDADVFYGIAITWGIAPPLLLLACFLTWHFIDKLTCFRVSDLNIKIQTSSVALLYLLWPSLASQTFSLFACRSVCDNDSTYLRADLDVKCGEGKQLYYALALGLPMLFIYVLGLPFAAFLKIHAMNKMLVRRKKIFHHDNEDLTVFYADHQVYGMFYSAFRKDTWWWEGTVAMRKIVIAMIGVFGAEMESMQVLITLMLVVCIIIITAQVRPFGGLKHGMLHTLEMSSLMATFLTLWAGSVFNIFPRCEDPEQGEGITILWCDVLSVVVGVVDVGVVVAFVVCFIYLKIESTKEKDPDDEENDDGSMRFQWQRRNTLENGAAVAIEMVTL